MTCLPLAGIGNDFALRHDEAIARRRCQDQLAGGIMHKGRQHVLVVFHIPMIRIGSPWPRPPGSLSPASV